MIITKIFKGEMAHVVRNCSTERCKYSIHGHSFIVEVSFTSDKLDNGSMLMDFSLVKKNIGNFIDAFDHCMCFWRKDSPKFKTAMMDLSKRWISLPMSPSAESLSLFFFYWVDKILKATIFNNGEGNIEVYSVKYHETTTGSATAFREDLKFFSKEDYEEVSMSEDVMKEFSENLVDLITDINRGNFIPGEHYFVNSHVK